MAQKNVVIGSTTYSGVDKIKVKDTSNNDVFFTETSDSNAVANEIENGKTAYVNGTKITGTHNDKTLGTKSITSNGTYNASSDSVDGYSSVTVDVQATVNNQNKTLVSNGEYTADSGYTGLGTVTVNVPSSVNNQNKTVTPSTSQQTVNADNGYSGLGTVTVNAVTSSIDENITASNIKKNVSILGVTGSFEGGITPTGTINISSNDTYDVTNYAEAVVNVPSQAGAYCFVPASSHSKGSSGIQVPVSVKLDPSTTQICRYAFLNLTGLILVDGIPNGVTTIYQEAFSGCSRYLNLSSLPTSLTTLGTKSFYNCSETLTFTSIPSGVKNIPQECFSRCALQNLTDFGSIKTIGTSAFSICSGLVDVVLPATLTSIGNSAFAGNLNMKTITLLSTSMVTGGSSMFGNCPKLEHIYVPSNLVDTYKADSNWSAYESLITAIVE